MRDDLGWPLSMEVLSREELRASVPELRRRGDWTCLNIATSTAWPSRAQSLEFAGHEVWIIPLTKEEHPGVAIDRPATLSEEEAEGILYRLLSAIAWREGAGIAVAHRTGGSWPMMMGLDRQGGFAVRQPFDFTEMLCPEELRPRIALGLMREGRSINHPGYAFLSFWRVLELAFPIAAERSDWMRDALPTLGGHDIPGAVESVRSLGVEDVGRHLFSSGRCAIAHATGDPIVNPDDPRDARRLARELPLVRELAIRAIEVRFGIDGRSKEYREHLYELRGWRRHLRPEVVGRIVGGEGVSDGDTIDLPVVSIRLRDRPTYGVLENMVAVEARAVEGILHLEYRTRDGLAAFRFALDFAGERLLFDLASGIFGYDDGSVAAADHRVGYHRFSRDLLLNGELQMWDAENGSILSRKDAFIPVNCYVDLDACNLLVEQAQEEAARRRLDAAGGGGQELD